MELALLGLKSLNEKSGKTFTILEDSNLKTKLSMKIMVSDVLNNLIEFSDRMEENEEWNFD